MPFFVNLPIRYVAQDPSWLDMFVSLRLNPELGIDAWAIDELDARFHDDLIRRLDEAGLARSAHLPFMDLRPGSTDPLILTATRDRLRRAMALARRYGAAHMIAHSGLPAGADQPFIESWLVRATATWSMLLREWPDHAPFYLENIYDPNPEPLCRLVDGLADQQAGLVFDAGHWHSFSGGAKRRDMRQWLERMGPRLRHLHLHDNSGAGDEHVGMGQGDIPWPELFGFLQEQGLTPGVTFEPHSREDFNQSLAFVAAHPEWFQHLGVAPGTA
ncbi:sugar phosphate isomerase/epimerase [Desulfocurvibacter africanus PCS]|uniref:Sugar phosphate isomerase/epimerase n=1 Tax=Desulfocurvibacter africanus PCS TaxID=1262666 RepID=M5PU12_DESAF|nr:sugar phosphate isomerase/epimerase [Desulfocurvibacter africanus]EMG37500.1 sugar phosphate isomerase/epimerase [Desulfocurvibacter africanus PCS]